jgi:hypothetical protein
LAAVVAVVKNKTAKALSSANRVSSKAAVVDLVVTVTVDRVITDRKMRHKTHHLHLTFNPLALKLNLSQRQRCQILPKLNQRASPKLAATSQLDSKKKKSPATAELFFVERLDTVRDLWTFHIPNRGLE